MNSKDGFAKMKIKEMQMIIDYAREKGFSDESTITVMDGM